MPAYEITLDNTLYRVGQARFRAFAAPPIGVPTRGRFDDPWRLTVPPDDTFGVIYAAESAEAAFVETLAGHRPALDVLATIQRSLLLDVAERDELAGAMRHPKVESSWWEARRLSHAWFSSDLPIFDLASVDGIEYVRERNAIALVAFGISDFDLSTVTSLNRDLTQAISRWLWSQVTEGGAPKYAGIRYASRFGADKMCIALFENRFTIQGAIHSEPIMATTSSLMAAAASLRLNIE